MTDIEGAMSHDQPSKACLRGHMLLRGQLSRNDCFEFAGNSLAAFFHLRRRLPMLHLLQTILLATCRVACLPFL